MFGARIENFIILSFLFLLGLALMPGCAVSTTMQLEQLVLGLIVGLVALFFSLLQSYLSKFDDKLNRKCENINNIVDYDNITFFGCKYVDFKEVECYRSQENIDFYILFKETMEDGLIQYSGSGGNKINSDWVKKYETYNGGDTKCSDFDLNKRVHKIDSFETICSLYKITSPKFKSLFFREFDKFKNIKDNYFFSFYELCDNIIENWYLDNQDSPKMFFESVLGKGTSFEKVLNNQQIDSKKNMISWSVWNDNDDVEFMLGIIKNNS